MPQPLMPKATAVWLVDNTALSFEQVADFCGLHALEVQGIADGEVAVGIVGLDPIANGQLTREEIARCEADPRARLELSKTNIPQPRRRTKGARYTPVSKRGDRPNAIAWILKFHPEVSDSQLQKLLGTTKATINAVRDRSHWNAQHIKPQDPVSLGICSQIDLDAVVRLARERRDAKLRKEGIEPAPQPAISPELAGMAVPEEDLGESGLTAGDIANLETPEDSREAAAAVFSDMGGEDGMDEDPGAGENEAEQPEDEALAEEDGREHPDTGEQAGRYGE